jgi:hypothetical protein
MNKCNVFYILYTEKLVLFIPLNKSMIKKGITLYIMAPAQTILKENFN